jgi:hypothetical protein
LKRNRCISLLFLAAIALLLAHGIIPHHYVDESCLVYHSDEHQNPPDQPKNLPWHCQAYSLVVLYEQQLVVKYKTILSPQDYPVTDQFSFLLFFTESSGNAYPWAHEQITNNPFVFLPSLRAPPFNS